MSSCCINKHNIFAYYRVWLYLKPKLFFKISQSTNSGFGLVQMGWLYIHAPCRAMFTRRCSVYPHAGSPLHVHWDTAWTIYEKCMGTGACPWRSIHAAAGSPCTLMGLPALGCTEHLCIPMPVKHNPAWDMDVIVPCERGLRTTDRFLLQSVSPLGRFNLSVCPYDHGHQYRKWWEIHHLVVNRKGIEKSSNRDTYPSDRCLTGICLTLERFLLTSCCV